MKSNPDKAKALLEKVLQQWKDGQKIEDLKTEKPPVYVADERWKAGRPLVGYTIDPEMLEHGPSVMIHVDLDFGPDKPPKRVAYLISTTPALSVALHDQ